MTHQPVRDTTPRLRLLCEQAHKLTPRQCEILDLLAAGYVGKEIAFRLGISYQTVKKHLAESRRRTGSRTTYQLLAWLLQARAA